MRNIVCINCGAPLEHRGSGQLVCPYCNAKVIDTTVGNWETNQAISTSMGLLARKAAKEELKEIKPELNMVEANLRLSDEIIMNLSTAIQNNGQKSVAPFRLWSFLIGLGSFIPWLVVLNIIIIGQNPDASELAKNVVWIGALVVAFLTGQFYRRSTIRKRKKAKATADLLLQADLDSQRLSRNHLGVRRDKLLAQIAELKAITEGRVKQ